ncbi:MAG: 50S ribosomal protein L3 [Parcubacteria group bacterium GW2011_GWA2_42_35]|nr:MAG: 50S ribosomal protein L3 [Parcubacteria group bacterium GW2011_GWA2_42_35]
MAKFILGIKKEMSQIFDENGNAIPVTLVEAGPMIVTQIKTKEKDGYQATQVGFGKKSSKNIKKPQRKAGSFRWLREFRSEELGINNYESGQKIDASIFNKGDVVKISGVSKGKGFQGVVKRHGFHGGPRSHGQKHSEREPGSIGATGPQRVFKGTRMPGRMGGERTTVRNLKVIDIVPEKNILIVKGAVPGRRGILLEIRG